MSIYNNFAKVYDLFMEETPYEDWINNIEAIWMNHNKNPKSILDMGCGTGTITNLLHKKGYDITGLDNSIEMLSEASSKSSANNDNILYICQDMKHLALHKPVDSIISYILEEKELLIVFNKVSKFLNKKGLFIFDINTLFKYENILSNNNFSGSWDNAAYIWENSYNEKTRINEYYTSFFIESEYGLYERYEEEHHQKAYSFYEMELIINKSELKLLEILDADTLDKANEKSQRVYFVLEENKK
jgi:SAM-dependent methyltransferase